MIIKTYGRFLGGGGTVHFNGTALEEPSKS